MSYNTYCRRRIAACEHLHAAAFKSLAASCYSGVPCFHPEPARRLEPSEIQVFRRVA